MLTILSEIVSSQSLITVTPWANGSPDHHQRHRASGFVVFDEG